jgi:hypothetical protein
MQKTANQVLDPLNAESTLADPSSAQHPQGTHTASLSKWSSMPQIKHQSKAIL